MGLRIYNVLGRERQDFVPLNEGRIGMYVCGPTVYDHAHLGHARNYVSFDVVVRYLRFSGYKVTYVQNITDVGHLLESGEDRILRKAGQLQAGPMQVVETYTRSFYEDMDALGVVRPDISPRASGHIPEQIKMIETLIRKENAYVVNGSVYFDVSTDKNYGKLSNRRIEEQEDGVREQTRDEKRNPEDFALWKKAEPEHILRWDSPWGEGFPGWHIECSAMAKKYLGTTFDIHGGGIDNLYPHNENEIAQSECANDADFARYWMLVGSLTVDSVKMSKSLGNFTTIKDSLKTHRPEVIRAFILNAHYSSPIDYSEDALVSAKGGWERLYNALHLVRQKMQTAPETSSDGNSFEDTVNTMRKAFTEAMDDDFNAPRAVAKLQDFTRDVNTLVNGTANIGLPVLSAIQDVYQQLGGDVLGIIPKGDVVDSRRAEREAALIEMLITMRAQARVNKNYAESDRIRKELAKIGVLLDDRPDGTLWRVES